ncbi:serine O-acetyltransferase [Thermoleophilum album]|uniref:Serine acetyltransferase n=1 Tax=Thermoleophilum album TaxID=29539 RepID=A0A1H6FY74_THEAL|nr:serine O-acetyltransferase [Thermoleophilum album]
MRPGRRLVRLFATATKAVGEAVTAARERDPAARELGTATILLTYGGVQAVLAHRVAHQLWRRRVPLVPHLIMHLVRLTTGVEIHPAATLGRRLFIDHGVGVVIGETAEVGDDVTLYQGVTLGGTGFARGKRHPTVGDRVVIGSGAKVLGPVAIGRGAKVGANSVVIHDVPANATVVGNPGHPVRVEGRRPEGPDADWAHLPDPVADAIKHLAERIDQLECLVESLTGRRPVGEVKRFERRRGPSSAGG